MRVVVACSRVFMALALAASVLTVPVASDGFGGRAVAVDEPPGEVTESQALSEARRLGKQVEVLALRGESREVFAQPDGRSLTAVQHLRPVRARKQGRWAEIDTSLERLRCPGSSGQRPN